MPRGIKPAELSKLRTALALSSVTDDPYPRDPRLLYQLVKALLGRIEGRDADDAKHCREVIHWIAALDRGSSANFATQIKTLLHLIHYPKRTRGGQHFGGVLQLQRAVLAFYLDANPYGNFRNQASRWLWVCEHGRQILAAFATVPCGCNYETSIDESDREKFKRCRTPGMLVKGDC